MSTLKRSERLAPKIFIENTHRVNQVREQIMRTARCIMPSNPNCVSSEDKVKMIIKVVKLVNFNYDIIKEYGNESTARFLRVLYKKSFYWIEETINLCSVQTQIMVKVFKKFRKKHETSRYASWEFMRIKFNLDANIMFCIDSYM
jgi:uncharacterized protein (DUF1499 family)